MILPELKRFACFADLSDEEREFFADAFREVALDAGEEVFREGEEADGLLLVLSGRLRLERRAEGLSGEVGAGAALGALSLLAPGLREASVFAETQCRALWLPRAHYRRVADDAPRAACRFVEHLLADLVLLVRPGLAHFLRGAVDPSVSEE